MTWRDKVVVNRYKAIFYVILCISLLTACSQQSNNSSQLLDKLTSEKYTGRLIGTDGNTEVVELLVEDFRKTKFKGLDGTFLHSFEEELINQYQKPIVLIGNNEINISLFPKYHVKKMDICGIINNRSEKTDLINSILLVETSIPKIERENLQVSAIIQKLNSVELSRYYVSPKPVEDIPYFYVNEEDYRFLEQYIDREVNIRSNSEYMIKKLNNVVAHSDFDPIELEEIIVIGAHFDHHGSNESGIFYGAVDNASGVEGLSQVMRGIESAEIPSNLGIFFVGFNGEESRLLGSKHFSKWINENYQVPIYALSIDMIGIKNSTTINLSGSSTLVEELRDQFVINGFSVMVDELNSSMSDHDSFIDIGEKGALIMDINEQYLKEDYHTTRDTKEWIDDERIEKIAAVITNFVENKAISLSMHNHEHNHDEGYGKNTSINILDSSFKEDYPLLENKDLNLVSGEKIMPDNRINHFQFIYSTYDNKFISVEISQINKEKMDPQVKSKGKLMFLGEEVTYYEAYRKADRGAGYTYSTKAHVSYQTETYFIYINTPLILDGEGKDISISEEEFIKLVSKFQSNNLQNSK